jgi:hypothetical protein
MRTKLKHLKCKQCRKEFQPKTKWQEFCKPACRTAAYNAKTAELIRKAVEAGL